MLKFDSCCIIFVLLHDCTIDHVRILKNIRVFKIAIKSISQVMSMLMMSANDNKLLTTFVRLVCAIEGLNFDSSTRDSGRRRMS